MEMKWKVVVCPDAWNEGKMAAHLLCTDLGDFDRANLQYLKTASGKDIVYGDFIAGGLEYSLHGDEVVNGVRKGGLRSSNAAHYPLPEMLEVTYSDGSEMDHTISPDRLSELSGSEPDFWITDPRAIWMSFYALLKDSGKISAACAVIPTREQAEAYLQQYGLQHDFAPYGSDDVNPYTALNKLRRELPAHLNELAENTKKIDPVDSAGYGIYTPEDLHYTFVTEIGVAGVFAVPDRHKIIERLLWQVRHADGHPIRLFLEREPGNQYDKNAICVMDSCRSDWERRKVGYVPRNVAAELAPQIDRGETFTGWLEYIEPGSNRIVISLYRRAQYPIDALTSIRYRHYAFGQQDMDFQIFLRTRRVAYRKRIEHFQDAWQWLNLTYDRKNWEEFALPALKKCNFFAWQPKRVKKQAPSITNSCKEIDLICGRKKIHLHILPWIVADELEEFESLMYDSISTEKIRGEGSFGVKTIPEFEKKKS